MKIDPRSRSESGRTVVGSARTDIGSARTVVGPADSAASAPATRKVHDRRRHPRLARELKTIRAMAWIYCHDLHGEDDALCGECAELMRYATRRLDRCIFGDDKPTCANCTVHCYNALMREQVRVMMRYAGPRMLLRHPLLALAHIRDGRRPAPDLPAAARAGVGEPGR